MFFGRFRRFSRLPPPRITKHGPKPLPDWPYRKEVTNASRIAGGCFVTMSILFLMGAH